MITDADQLEQQVIARTGGDPLVRRAIQVAHEVHAGAVRDEGSPYVCHPLRVALIVLDELAIADRELVCAGLLHDALEDSPEMTDERLAAEFGPRVAGLVRCLTDEFKKSGLPRQERKARYLTRVARADADCLMLKLCDRLDNLRSLPYSHNLEKARLMRHETRAYLLSPAVERPRAVATLLELIRQALAEEK